MSGDIRLDFAHHPLSIRPTSLSAQYRIEPVDWATEATALYAIRYRVFVEEQRVPVELERDDYDPVSLHVIARTTAGQAIGTGRLLPDGHIGRLAVLAHWRHRGIGRAMMRTLLELASERGFRTVHLNAQTYAIAFYEQLGFRIEGDVFMEAGIPHRSMFLEFATGVDHE